MKKEKVKLSPRLRREVLQCSKDVGMNPETVLELMILRVSRLRLGDLLTLMGRWMVEKGEVINEQEE